MTIKYNSKSKIFIKTFGCQMNKADSRRLLELFLSQGYEITKEKESADIMIYNTCSVREHAEEKAMSHLGRLKFIKENNPDVIICVVGCMAQRMGEEIVRRIPHVDIVVGPSSMFKLPKMLEEGQQGIFLDTPDTIKEFSEYVPNIAFKNMEYSGYVPIMKGCSNFCTYCIVPFVRGREQYRDKSEIIHEIEALAKRGIKEIMLLGQTVNSHPLFNEILRDAAGVSDIERIRFVTSYPGNMRKDTVDLVGSEEKLCKYFHLAAQSGSDKVLKAMGRKYSDNEFLDIALYIRETIPMASISTDFIVGFPGETEEDFSMTLDLVKKVRFDRAFTFKYSTRPFTAAAKFDDDLPDEVKKDRLRRLNDLCKETALERNKLLLGKTLKVMADKKRSGRSDTYKPVFWEGEPASLGESVYIKITEALPHSLKGIRL